jgi:two-component system sensor histidine kinase HydH
VKKKSTVRRILFIVSALVLIAAVALLWFNIIRESSRRELHMEYEAFRKSSEIADEYRRDNAFSPSFDKKVLGFGFYRIDGSLIQKYGTAPNVLTIPQILFTQRQASREGGLPGSVSSSFSDDGNSIQLLRYSGLMNPGRSPGMGMGRNRLDSLQIPSPSGALNPAIVLQALSNPHFIWIEYSADDFMGERLFSYTVAILITLSLLAFYVLLIGMFRKNELLLAREIESRELVQLGEAARTLVHEIKNPLGIMRIQTSKIRRNAAGTGLEASAMIIEGEILRLSILADRIRDFLKSSQAKIEELDLLLFLKSFTDRYGDLNSMGISLELELPQLESATALADREKLVIALDNLVSNSIEAVKDSQMEEKKITVRLYQRERRWAVAVMDTGKGIPLDLQRRIFDPFFTTKERGSGIGLALARRFVESFGGTISYEGAGKSGAIFVITLTAKQ